MKKINESRICMSCTDKCCTQPYVKIPLTAKEAEIVRGLGYDTEEERGLILMPSNHWGCEAYNDCTGKCDIYTEKPGFCSLYPVKIAAIAEPLGIYDAVRNRPVVIKVNCKLGKAMQASEINTGRISDDLWDVLEANALQFNAIREGDFGRRVRNGECEVIHYGRLGE